MPQGLNAETLENLADEFGLDQQTVNRVHDWMQKNFDTYDSLTLADEAYDEFMDEEEIIEEDFLELMITLLYENNPGYF